MGNESLNFLKSAGKNIVSEIVNDLSETGITEALIKEGIPINRLMTVVSKEMQAKIRIKMAIKIPVKINHPVKRSRVNKKRIRRTRISKKNRIYRIMDPHQG